MTSANPDPAFTEWLAAVSRRVNGELAAILDRPTRAPQLAAAMRHAALNGGKRIRPAMLLAVAEAKGGEDAAALSAACALELAHCYSLVHDDLPAMDNAETRRGKPSCHRQYGEATAILAGDCLQSLAFEVMAEALPLAVPLLAGAIGANGMGAGQSLDLANDAKTEHKLAKTHQLKTGRLFQCALGVGILFRVINRFASNSKSKLDAETTALDEFGKAFGLMFQICDDLRGEEDDRKNGRKTYATLLGREAAQKRAEESRDRALRALNGKHPRLAAIAEMVFAQP